MQFRASTSEADLVPKERGNNSWQFVCCVVDEDGNECDCGAHNVANRENAFRAMRRHLQGKHGIRKQKCWLA
jgi:hypothetical protein